MSIDFDFARKAFETFFTEDFLQVPVEYENVPENASLKAAKNSQQAWARVTVQQAAGFATDIGPNRTHRFPGILTISIFTPVNKGTKALRDLASSVAQETLENSFTGIEIRSPELNIVGRQENWYMGNVIIPFQIDQRKS